ncbi:MAG: 1-deoxy-D-xylulose-5-phosphate reductoisomerase, partial [Deltaproteobacteria bacterium]|nr:1-deoxy-D-xylulose-5-phosphate reductoisomerase [Deltaproteobacteria bacterium]
NEVAVAAFLEGRIKFPDIPRVVARTMAAHQPQTLTDLEQVLAVNQWARDFAGGLIFGQS